MANTSTLKPRPENLTPHFRNLLREENPLWETPDFYRWSWGTDGPVVNGLMVDLTKVDSCHPGGTAIMRMIADIEKGVWQLTRHPAPRFIP